MTLKTTKEVNSSPLALFGTYAYRARIAEANRILQGNTGQTFLGLTEGRS